MFKRTHQLIPAACGLFVLTALVVGREGDETNDAIVGPPELIVLPERLHPGAEPVLTPFSENEEELVQVEQAAREVAPTERLAAAVSMGDGGSAKSAAVRCVLKTSRFVFVFSTTPTSS